jgi:hypothetical protein
MREGANYFRNTAIQTLLDLGDQEPVAYFYFDLNKPDELTTEALLRSYVKQLLRHLYKARRKPSRKIKIAVQRVFGLHVNQTILTELVEIVLKPLIQDYESPFLVVDGLDLCSPQECLLALDHLSNLLQETAVQVIICGRDDLDVTTRLPGSVRLKVTHEKTSDDVALFIEHYIKDRHSKYGSMLGDASTIARIKDTLIRQAEGMYVCNPVFDSISTG